MLNTEQVAAVKQPFDRHAIVRAAPGAGKTRVLVERILHLIGQGVAPSQVRAITFTNRAAKEIKARLRAVNGDLDDLAVSTFHGLGYNLLKDHFQLLGFQNKPTVVGNDVKHLLKKALERAGVRVCKAENTLDYPKRLEAAIHQIKNDGLRASEFAQQQVWGYIQGLPVELIKVAYSDYEDQLFTQNLLDFDDLILLSTRLLTQHPNLTACAYLLVDEFQDTSTSQYQMMKLLGAETIMVIGDPLQSIYSWRGANPDVFEVFAREFEPLNHHLSTNHRSTGGVLEAGNRLMAHCGVPKMVSSREQGQAIRFYEASSDAEEAAFIASELQFFGLNNSYDQAAVLVRMSSQIRIIEKSLASAGVPYRLVGSHSFWERIEIKLAVMILRLAANPLFEAGLIALIEQGLKFSHVDGGQKLALGETSLETVQVYSAANGMPLLNALGEDLRAAGLGARAANAAQWIYHVGMPALLVHNTPRSLVEHVMRVWGYLPWLESLQDDPEAVQRLESLGELFDLADQHQQGGGDLEGFLEVITLERSQQSVVQGGIGEHVTVSTIHAAKGLEWFFVIVPGWDQGVLPSGGSLRDNAESGEELRVAFVAVTRAKEQLLLTRAAKRRINGDESITSPSQYLSLLNGALAKTQISAMAVFGAA
jgi:superfamily I DNA/RNA helicase